MPGDAPEGSSDACPACEKRAPPRLVEEHFDKIGGRRYQILECPACGVVFSQPRQAVGPDWYEKAAPIREKEPRPPEPASDWRFRSFLRDSPGPGRLLDVACGDGSFLLMARSLGYSCAGFDYESRMIALARSRGLADVEAAEFDDYCARRRDQEFDFVTLFDVLEHTPEPARFLKTVKRPLKIGGFIALTMPNAERPLPWGREEHDFPPHHFTRWSAQAMRGFLSSNGFEVVRQDAGHLKVSYLADHAYFNVMMPRLLKPARALLFGRSASGTISELYQANKGAAPGLLADKWRRQRLVNVFKFACAPFTYGFALLQYAWFKMSNPRCGDCLYTFARRIR